MYLGQNDVWNMKFHRVFIVQLYLLLFMVNGVYLLKQERYKYVLSIQSKDIFNIYIVCEYPIYIFIPSEDILKIRNDIKQKYSYSITFVG